MSNYYEDYVSADFVIRKVLDDMDVDDVSKYKSSMYEWCYTAELLIGNVDGALRKKEQLLDVENHRAKLPKDFYKLDSLKHGNLRLQYTGRDFVFFHKDSEHLAQVDNTSEVPHAHEYKGNQYSDDVFRFSGRYIHTTYGGDKLGISYYAAPIGDDGCPYIKKGHEEAVSSYIQYKLVRRLYLSGKRPLSMKREAEMDWELAAARAFVDDVSMTNSEIYYIGMLWNSHTPPGDLNAI